MASAAGWRTGPVFIPSTFRDVQKEQSRLRDRVLSERDKERPKDRRHHLESIDLRCGVDPSATDEAAELSHEFLVLKVCLGDVERSRRFLIGLLGDRYGWAPPEDRMVEAADEAGLMGPVAGEGVIELEIDHGVPASSEQCPNRFFYLRDPLPYDEIDAKVAAQYSEAHDLGRDVADAARKLGAPKVIDVVGDSVTVRDLVACAYILEDQQGNNVGELRSTRRMPAFAERARYLRQLRSLAASPKIQNVA